jgi:hypothetical protein
MIVSSVRCMPSGMRSTRWVRKEDMLLRYQMCCAAHDHLTGAYHPVIPISTLLVRNLSYYCNTSIRASILPSYPASWNS